MKENCLKCEICGITEETKIITKVHGTFMCSKHKAQYYRHGKIIDPSPMTTQDRNEIILHEDYAEIILRNKTNNITGTVLVDLEDVDRLSNYKWRLETGYAIFGKSKKNKISMHRFILNYYGELEVDHINRNKLDNRKDNLRIVPKIINMQNIKTDKKHLTQTNSGNWVVKIRRFGTIYRFGPYKNKEDALSVRNNFLSDIQQHEKELIEEYEKNKIKEKGVTFNGCGKYSANICMNGKYYYLGSFPSIEEAILARSNKIKELTDVPTPQ